MVDNCSVRACTALKECGGDIMQIIGHLRYNDLQIRPVSFATKYYINILNSQVDFAKRVTTLRSGQN
jgi:hypothetical protein